MVRTYRPVGIRKLVCRRCGEHFEARRTDTVFCPPCRPLAKRERDKAARVYRPDKKYVCPVCDGPMARRAGLCRSCAKKAGKYRFPGESNPHWKGGKTRAKGYVYIRNYNGRRYVGEHIVVWEQANGPVPPKWVVHHLNGIKDDNRLENLVAMPRSHHGPRAHIDPAEYEARIRSLEARIVELEV